ncbi:MULTISPECIES: hypothetical protein [unclassified Vibrio]|uniref:hypothetical protein n=4 Tax=Vibrio TaxID=662 RepID=UPI00354F4C98
MSINRWKIPTEIEKVTAEQATATQEAIKAELDCIDSVIDDVDKKLRRAREVNNSQDISTLEEVKRVAYGKSVLIESDVKGIQEYRVTQVAGSYANTKHGVSTSLSPIGTLCRQAYIGLSGKSKLLGNYEVLEIRTFERFKGHVAADNLRNFQTMVRSSFSGKYSNDVDEYHTQDLKKTVLMWSNNIAENELTCPEDYLDTEETTQGDITWGVSEFGGWDEDDPVDDIILDEPENISEPTELKDEYFGLSSNFYLNPTREQYKVMSNTLDTGPMLVEGIAGSGKTCAALGRAKTLVDLSKVVPDESDEYEATDFFDQESSVGIVRTGELVQYLKQTCNELGLSHLPIIEYDELRSRLQLARELEQRSKTDNSPKYALSVDLSENDESETTMSWLESFDKVLFDLLLTKVDKVVDQLTFDTNKFEPSESVSTLLLSTLTDKLKLKLQTNIAQWKTTRVHSHFACEDLIPQLYQLIRVTVADTVDRSGFWYSIKDDEPEFTTSLSNLFGAYRSHKHLFLDKQERTCFQLSSQQDLSTFVEKCELVELSIQDVPGQIELNTPFDELWDKVSEEDTQYLIGKSSNGALFKGKLVDVEQLSFLRSERRLFVLQGLSSRVRPFERPSPYTATITPTSKGGKPTSFSNFLRARLIPRLFNHWHIADLYRDALLFGDKDWGSKNSDALNRLIGRKLNTHDIDVLLAMSHIIGAKGNEEYGSIPTRWHTTQYYRSVFVDEVQDFTEIQVFIMGRQASPEYDAVTMVGDMHQQLSGRQAKDLDACFPYRKLSKHLLIENKRQEFNATLGSISQIFRRFVQGDIRLSDSFEHVKMHLDNIRSSDGYTFSSLGFESAHDAILDVIRTQPQTRTIGVLTPNLNLAKTLEENLREGLKSVFRESYVSETVQLNKKYQIHFSSPEHIKGLEFDTVILAGLEEVEWTKKDKVNGVYVALSRPRKELHVVSLIERLPTPVARLLSAELSVEEVWRIMKNKY